MKQQNKFILNENEMPTRWYNVHADMVNKTMPPLHPGTLNPIGPEDLAGLFPMELIKQEVSMEQFIEIPEEVQDIYRIWRSTPLVRAHNLEKLLGTPARIYYKNESVSPSGSHKPNTAVAQAYYNYKEGVKQLTTETGAGQWGSALAFATGFFGIKLKVFMVRVSYDQKPYRKSMMNVWGADVTPSPSMLTNSGRQILAANPDSPGSLGIAISEAVEMAAGDPETKYSLGSVLNHVLLHQTIIGEEAILQMEKANDYPDIVIGCFGGGSNFAGITFPFLRGNLLDGNKTRFIAVEPSSCPKLTRGEFKYDFGDTAGLTPLIPMYTLGHDFIPPEIHAGGLRYHGAGAIVSQLLKDGLIEAASVDQFECFDAGLKFARAEGIIPAPESTHAIAQAIREAERCREEGVTKSILFNLSGHGLVDLAAYDSYLSGSMKNFCTSDQQINTSLNKLYKVA
ncbi:MAG: TrpB-like pyridoxal phosphate-dependent enzyme [Bacteroidales bacterium]|nr:TrpB-like pyridoxal phosphate-dependent enzyme [Bacteroidales bacterium]